jgi:hypothetical protein
MVSLFLHPSENPIPSGVDKSVNLIAEKLVRHVRVAPGMAVTKVSKHCKLKITLKAPKVFFRGPFEPG